MAYKDSFKTMKEESEPDSNAMFFSRPLVLAGKGFGVLNFFFDPDDIHPKEIEKISNLIADFVDEYWENKERMSTGNLNG